MLCPWPSKSSSSLSSAFEFENEDDDENDGQPISRAKPLDVDRLDRELPSGLGIWAIPIKNLAETLTTLPETLSAHLPSHPTRRANRGSGI